MNKLVLNVRGINYFKVMPFKGVTVPEDEKEKYKWCENLYNELCEKGENVFTKKRSKQGYMVSVWNMNEYSYLVVSIRNGHRSYGATVTYSNTIYMATNSEDLINIAKFLGKNVNTLMSDYASMMHDAAANNTDNDDAGTVSG